MTFLTLSAKYKHLEDHKLLEQYRQSGNLELLGALYHRYMHLVYGLCLKYLKHPEDSKDAVMQVFEKLTNSVRETDIRNFKSWLYVVARNHCLMTLRGQKKTTIEDTFVEMPYELHPNGEETTDSDKLQDALDRLPEHQRQCLQLFYYQSKSYHEIAVETGFDIKKVKSYIQNGKRNLKGYLDKK